MKPLIIFLTNILTRPEIPERLELYKDRVEVAVLDAQGQLSIEERLSKSISLMASLPISHFLISGDPVGHAYWLSRSESSFPTLRKLKATRFPWGHLPEAGYWEEVDVPGFNKPYAYLIEGLMQELQSSHTLLVCDSDLDRETSKDLGFAHQGGICEQSSDEWLKRKTPEPWQQQPQTAQTTPAASGSASRYFEYINYSENASKFWRITLRSDELGFQTRYGRIGTKGQSRLKVFTTPFACRNAYGKVIQQKLRKGYVECQLPSAQSNAFRMGGVFFDSSAASKRPERSLCF
ncbi:MAG: WGR domain-containing protein [Cyanobacteria bacterium P01_C01_bin.120]